MRAPSVSAASCMFLSVILVDLIAGHKNWKRQTVQSVFFCNFSSRGFNYKIMVNLPPALPPLFPPKKGSLIVSLPKVWLPGEVFSVFNEIRIFAKSCIRLALCFLPLISYASHAFFI